MFDLSGKTALVTGSSRGIGKAIALALAGQGADIAVHYLSNEEAAKGTVAAVEALGRKAIMLQADAREAVAYENLFQTAEKELAPIDILVNNAGVLKHGFLGLLSEAGWDEVMNADLKAAFLLSKRAARSMSRRKSGRIINISSQAGQMGEVMAAHYSAAKAGLLGLTKTAARELAPYGVTCNAIAPGFVQTDMTTGTAPEKMEKQKGLVPLGRFGLPEEIAAMAVYLASDEAAYVTGQVFAIDGGLRM